MSQELDESWLPRFEKRDDHWVVHFQGQEWWLLTAPRVDYPQTYGDTWGPFHRNHPWHEIEIRIRMAHRPPAPDLSIPDSIVLGEN